MLEQVQLVTRSGLQQLTIAALLIYFGKISTSSEFIFGIPIHKRASRKLRNTVGMFSGVLPFKGGYDKEQKLTDFLKDISNSQKRDYRHQNYQVGDLTRYLKINSSSDRLFEVLVNYELFDFELNFDGLDSRIIRLLNEDERNPLQISWKDYGKEQGLELQVQFRYEYFTQEEIESMTYRILFILKQFPGALDKHIDLINILPRQETDQLLAKFNNTAADYPKDKSIINPFEEQAANYPDVVAVIYEEIQLTYGELNERSNQLAHYLQKKGVRSETLVPICIERRPEMIIGLLGILKAGAAYVPIDPEYPQERINYMLEDTGAALLLSSNASREKVSAAAEVITLDEDWELISREDSSNLHVKPQPGQLAYVIYTSGSTGRPKGVMVEHGGVVNRLNWAQNFFQVTSRDVILQKTNFSFDVSVWELFLPLFSGARLVFAKPGGQIDNNYLRDIIANRGITMLHFVPSMLSTFLVDLGQDDFKDLKNVICSGEALNLSVVESFRKKLPDKKLHNLYGPTEASIDVSYWSLLSEDADIELVPIGKPVDNTQLYILGPDKGLVPIGVHGEIYIGGVQLARGYLNREELTAEKFIPDTFSKETGARLYRTGDLGRWLADGNIDYLGRIDDQVKIRGYRIELGEIESVLEQSGLVSQAVVLAREDKQGNKRLVGYVVQEGELDKQALHDYLGLKLPDYMVPVLWIALDRLPLTPNGKIDKKSLPDPEYSDLTALEFVAPRTAPEKALAAIWQDLLSLERVGVHDNFLSSGGIHCQLCGWFRRSGGKWDVELAIKDIFIYPTIALLARQFGSQNTGLSIPPIENIEPRPDLIPLSFSQERLWFIDQLGGSIEYHVPAVIRMKGEISVETLANTLRHIVNRHEVLRTVIVRDAEGVGYQHIMPESGWNLTYENQTGNDKGSIEQLIERLIDRPFDLSADYMLRASLINAGDEEHVLVVTMHHIASDGWSASILVKEVVALYAAYEANLEPELSALPVQYADYAIWQRNWLQGSILEEKLKYWKEKLARVLPLELPADYLRPSTLSTSGASMRITIDKETTSKLHAIGQQRGTTLYMTLLSAFKVLLHRYSGQEDICVGTPIAGRQHQELEGLVGFFVNTLALRSQVNGDASFITLLEQVKDTMLEAYGHQEVPFEKVVDAVVKERDMSRSPLFQVMFDLVNTPDVPVLRLGNVELTLSDHVDTTSKFDLSLSLAETDEGLKGSVEYNTGLYKQETIGLMLSHFKQLLRSIVADPDKSIGSLRILASSEEQALLADVNVTYADYQKGGSIINLFEEQVAKSPAMTAVIFEDNKLSYAELNARSNQLANYLRRQGVKSKTLVPICIERSLEMMVGILGILKAGGAYVPIDPEYPQDRISYMLEDTAAGLVLSSKASREKLLGSNVSIIELDGDWELINAEYSEDLSLKPQPDHLAYVIYTSGSTGRPKGVMVEHGNVVSIFHAWSEAYELSSFEIRLLQLASMSFDVFTGDMCRTLLVGGTMIICPEEIKFDLDGLYKLIIKHEVNIFESTPGLILPLMKYVEEQRLPFNFMKVLILGSDILNPQAYQHLRHLYAARFRIINSYGTTETTIDSLYFEGDVEDYLQTSMMPIGKPYLNTHVYILNKSGEKQPVGIPGELFIGGLGVSRGYLHRTDLTSERFVTNPFEPGMLYRTGDLVKWRTDGNIEYLGRMDDQVKIRGYRIELGEIESVLMQSGMVSHAVALAREDINKTKRLIGYIVQDGELDKQAIQAYLHGKLPEYMVPSLWVGLDELPLTPNGKVDKNALPDPELTDILTLYVSPRNETEQALAGIWQQLLGLEQIGIHDNFFELGGHSLLAMRVISSIRKELEVELNIRDLFVHPSIAGLGAYIDEQSKGSLLPAIVKGNIPQQIPLSFSQERLWFIDRLEGSLAYHLPAVLRLRGRTDRLALSKALGDIVSRHEILRTVYEESNGGVYQRVKAAGGRTLTEIEGSRYAEDQQGLERYIQALTDEPFDLGRDDMFRASLIRLSEEDHILVVTMHHIASDAASISVLVREVAALYSAYVSGEAAASLPELPLQYADYAVWQREHVQGEFLEEKLGYWKTKLEDVTPLQLPSDNLRSAAPGGRP